jgi:hypothetical protein
MWSEGDVVLRREVLNDGSSWAEVDVLVVRAEPECLRPTSPRYLNLQEPFRRTPEGYDTQDHELDIWVPADGTWVLKDDELLDVRVREGRFTQDQARAFRAEAARVTAELDAGRRWWADAWASWRPHVA